MALPFLFFCSLIIYSLVASAAAPPAAAPEPAASRAPFPGSSPLAPPFVWDVDNSTGTVDTARWAPALVSGRAWNLYGWVGLMPRINNDGSFVNGGLPQAGNVSAHLEKLRRDLQRLLPARASGACLLDWEFWRAEWNYTGDIYKNASIARAAASLPPGTPAAQVLAAATREYEAGARTFFEASLAAVASWYPGCLAGIYAYPANDWSFGGYVGPRAAAMRAVNDGLRWLWAASSALYPSVYLTSPGASKYDGQTTAEYVGSTVAEAARCAAGATQRLAPPLVLPLAWYVYDAFPRPAPPAAWQLLTEGDTRDVVALPAARGADALLVWGAVGAPPFAPEPLAAYLTGLLGPALNASYGDALACAASRCSGRGRCIAGGACACVPPATGPTCSGP